MSSTVAKALSLLDHFSEEEPELGLSELARRSGVDKATVHRILAVMSDAGMVEQRSDTRLYRLGAGLLRLARVREETFPVTAVYQAALDTLTAQTGETSHASLVSGRVMATIAVRESTRSSRVSLVAGEILPFHCTGSGIVVLAFGDPKLRERVLKSELTARTARSATSPEALETQIQSAVAAGYAIGDQTNEEDVYGIAAPVFDGFGLATGAVAVATPAHRMTEALHTQIVAATLREARNVTIETGGRLPPSYAKTVATLPKA